MDFGERVFQCPFRTQPGWGLNPGVETPSYELLFLQGPGAGRAWALLGGCRSGEGKSHPAGFVLGFFKFGSGVRVGDDAGADVVVEVSVFVNEGADGDVELGFAVEAEVAHGAGVETAWGGLEFGDDFGGAFFGRAGDGAAGEAGTESIDGRLILAEGSANGGDEVVDVLEFFELEHVGDLHGAVFTNLAEIVAEEVGDHDELGSFFFGTLEFEGRFGVEFGVGEAGAGAFDGAGFDFATGEAEEGLGRGREDFAAIKVEVGGGGGGGGVAEALVEREESAGCFAGSAEASREVDLVDVSRCDVVLGFENSGDEFGLVERGGPGAELEVDRRGGFAELRGKVSGFPPLAGLVVVNEDFGVNAEGVGAIVVDPAAGSAGGESVVAGEGILPGGEGFLRLVGSEMCPRRISTGLAAMMERGGVWLVGRLPTVSK